MTIIWYLGYAQHVEDEIRAPSRTAMEIFIMLEYSDEEKEPEKF